jgi:hypothetical protein
MIKHNKIITETKSCNNFLELELQKEKTKQLEIIRDIRKLELKLKLNKSYERNNKSFDVYKMLNSLSSDNSESCEDNSENSTDENTDDDSGESCEDNCEDNCEDSSDDDSLINDTISMYSVKSVDDYNEVDTIDF